MKDLSNKVIGITMGDSAGIGPEVIIKALSCPKITKKARFILIGDKRVFERYGDISNWDILDTKNIKEFTEGIPTNKTGKASIECIMEGIRLIREKKIFGLVTAPICKEAIHKAGFNFMGHTDLLRKAFRRKVSMMFVSEKLKVVLVTIHVGLSKVSRLITEKNVYETILRTNDALISYFGIKKPRICVLGLNPHAGEGGTMGREEEKIKKAIELARSKNIDTEGPYPPDSAFLKKGFDSFVAMYHDQGLIPFKLFSFDCGANLTIGLPFIRTSPDHGCAFDIAGKNIASPMSMVYAINLTEKLLGATRP